ncbi:sugar phosphate isomerase/epimerase [Novosphingobium sp. MW5]|nr:sugar phosphate isomerase/epimerase [Novosphingobium sp. MW5]
MWASSASAASRRSATATSPSARSACSAIRWRRSPWTRRRFQGWKDCIDNAHHFGATCVAGFTGRLRGRPIEDSLPRYREVWSELARRAADRGVRIAFENCAMDGNWQTGDWNIAHNPDAWELMFNETLDDNLGLEWEPCHQLVYLIDPLPQIRKMGRQDLPRPRQGRDRAS